jgi:hypothetical protein
MFPKYLVSIKYQLINTEIHSLSKKLVQYVYKNYILQILGYINVAPLKYTPLDTIHLSHLRFHCWKHPWNSSSLKPFSSNAVSLLIVVTPPPMLPPQHQFAFGEQEKIAGG